MKVGRMNNEAILNQIPIAEGHEHELLSFGLEQ